MSELKTLTELLFNCELQAKRETKFTQEHEYELKEEAIKWVKECRLPPFGVFCEFFNITKEDLQ